MNRRKRSFAKGALRSATPPHLRRRRGRLLAELLAGAATLDRRNHLSLCRSKGDPLLQWLRQLPNWLGSGGLSRSGPRRWRYRLTHRRGLGELLALAASAATQPSARKLLADLALGLGVPLPPPNPSLIAAAPHSIRRRPPPLTR
jgi:hypothetical protein